MSNEKNTQRIPQFEVEFPLPILLPGPLQLDDGTVLAVGDQVEHPDYGRGTIVRICAYEVEPRGPFVYVDYGNDVRKMQVPSFVKKV